MEGCMFLPNDRGELPSVARKGEGGLAQPYGWKQVVRICVVKVSWRLGVFARAMRAEDDKVAKRARNNSRKTAEAQRILLKRIPGVSLRLFSERLRWLVVKLPQLRSYLIRLKFLIVISQR
jgi:hypothetical protein